MPESYQSTDSLFHDRCSSVSEVVVNENSTTQSSSGASTDDMSDTPPPKATSEEFEAQRLKIKHLKLLSVRPNEQEHHEATTTPTLTMQVMRHIEKQQHGKNKPVAFPQYGLLAGAVCESNDEERSESQYSALVDDPRIFFNTASPSSTFICGSQGSGKSHTLSCLLENSLFASDASKLPHPLAGLVFHYDTFISDHGGSPCEAAFLASNKKIKVRVLCAPTNIATIKMSRKIEIESPTKR